MITKDAARKLFEAAIKDGIAKVERCAEYEGYRIRSLNYSCLPGDDIENDSEDGSDEIRVSVVLLPRTVSCLNCGTPLQCRNKPSNPGSKAPNPTLIASYYCDKPECPRRGILVVEV